MSINYSRHRRAIEKMYDSKCTIMRNEKEKDPVTKETKLKPTKKVCEDQPCRISQKALATNGQTEAQNKIRYETKLFIAPEFQIRQGDEITVTPPAGRAMEYTAGEPFPPYPTHQEISIQRKADA